MCALQSPNGTHVAEFLLSGLLQLTGSEMGFIASLCFDADGSEFLKVKLPYCSHSLMKPRLLPRFSFCAPATTPGCPHKGLLLVLLFFLFFLPLSLGLSTLQQTHAITNIGWTPELRQWYADNRDTGLIFQNMATLFGHVIKASEVVISNEPAGDPRSSGVPAGHPAVSTFLGVPLLAGGHGTPQHSAVHDSTGQSRPGQYSTGQYSIVQNNTVQ